jgi:hypothetical protein
LSAPWWTPPPFVRDVDGWLDACREVEALVGIDEEAVPASLGALAAWAEAVPSEPGALGLLPARALPTPARPPADCYRPNGPVPSTR